MIFISSQRPMIFFSWYFSANYFLFSLGNCDIVQGFPWYIIVIVCSLFYLPFSSQPSTAPLIRHGRQRHFLARLNNVYLMMTGDYCDQITENIALHLQQLLTEWYQFVHTIICFYKNTFLNVNCLFFFLIHYFATFFSQLQN